MNTTASAHSPRLLVIDDNRAIHEDFRKILCGGHRSTRLGSTAAELFGEQAAADAAPARAVHFSLDFAAQGQEGLELVRTALAEGRPYAMAFVDIRMPPGWDGIETVERIWRIHPHLQVVICTAYSDYSWEDMVRKLGHSDRLVILKKPFDNIEALQLATALSEKSRLLQVASAHVESLEATVVSRTEALRKSEEKFRLITENAGDLITIIDRQGRRIYHSPSYCSLLGYSDQELAAAAAIDHVHPSDRPTVLGAAQQVFEHGHSAVVEYRLQHRNGTWRTLEAHAAPFRSRAGGLEGALFVGRDVTERRALELQLRQAQKLEAIGRLAAGVAHEINTPTQFIGDNLRFIQGAFGDLMSLISEYNALFEAARRGPVGPELIARAEEAIAAAELDYLCEEMPKAIEQALEGVDRTAHIVRSMKEFSHPGTTEKILFDLNRAVECTFTISRHEWKYVADVVVELDPQLPPVLALPGEINQVLLNLVINAAQAIGGGARTGSKGVITASTRRDGMWAEVRIRDTGPGIPEHVRDRIFEPFFTTKEVGKGTGQGLAMARAAIVDRHGGKLNFETETGTGTTFIVRLPLDVSSASGHGKAA